MIFWFVMRTPSGACESFVYLSIPMGLRFAFYGEPIKSFFSKLLRGICDNLHSFVAFAGFFFCEMC